MLHELHGLHSSQRWRTILFEFTLIAPSLTTLQSSSFSLINTINQCFNLIISVINQILTIIAELQAYSNMAASYFNNTSATNAISFTTQTLPAIKNITVPLLQGSTTLIYNQFKPETYTNYYFENQNINYSSLPQLAPFATTIDSESLGSLLSIYNSNVQNIITQINQYGVEAQAQNLINSLINSYVSLMDLAKALSTNNSENYISYTVPHSMSIREVCFKNGLDFQDTDLLKKIATINSGKFSSVNKIPAKSVLMLPK